MNVVRTVSLNTFNEILLEILKKREILKCDNVNEPLGYNFPYLLNEINSHGR